MGRRKTNPTVVRSKIAELRMKHDITQRQVASATGMSLKEFQDIERGNRWNPPIRSLVAIAEAFGVTLEEVCEDAWLRPTKFMKYQRKASDEPVERLKDRKTDKPLGR